jgi:hypothetical protein
MGLNYSGTVSCTNCSVYQYFLVGLGLTSGDILVGPHEPTTQVNRWNGGNSPTAGCATGTQPAPTPVQCNGATMAGTAPMGNSCPSDWIYNFATPWYNLLNSGALHSYVPAGLVLAMSVAYTPEMDIAWTDYSGTGCNTKTYAECLADQTDKSVWIGGDVYDWGYGYTTCSGTCSPTNGTYPYTFGYIQSHSSSGGGQGHPLYFQEFGPPVWVVTNTITGYSAPAGGGCAISGADNCTWLGFHRNFFASSLGYLASFGGQSATIFNFSLLVPCTPVVPDGAQSPPNLYRATTAMQNAQFGALLQNIAGFISGWNRNSAVSGTTSGIHF